MVEDSIKPVEAPNKQTMMITPYTKNFKALLPYAIPYALGYMFFDLALEQINFPLGGLLLSAFVVLIVSALLILVFKMTQKRFLEKIECSRIGIIGALITVLISSLLLAVNLGGMLPVEITLSTLSEKGLTKLFFIQFVVMFFIHYAVICYSLWFMQKPLQSKTV